MGASHPVTSFTNTTFDYEDLRAEEEGAFWDLPQSPDDIKNPFKTVDVDVAEWVAAKRALVKQQGMPATLLSISETGRGKPDGLHEKLLQPDGTRGGGRDAGRSRAVAPLLRVLLRLRGPCRPPIM